VFTQAQIEELLATLRSPVTDFDCGTLCAPGNDGIPVCCDRDRIVPVLYKTEYKLLRQRSDLWSPFRPRTKQQASLGDDLRSCDKLCQCKGVAHCERENRSLACRTFPLEPYLDHDGRLVGLVYNFDFQGTCPLVGSRHPIRPQYVDECMIMWEKAFSWSEEEWEFYFDHSETLRRSFGQKRKRIPVYTREGIVRMPTARAKRQRAGRRAG
jgi:hypothetical protein